MKTIEKPVDPSKTEYLSKFFEHPEDVLFFDIETTGFSPRGASIYLLGCAYFSRGCWQIRQYFAETPAQEGEIVRAFCSFAATFSCFIHFNGQTFDIPFIAAKCKRHALPAFAPDMQCDIYKSISPYKNLLHLPGCRQKQLEEFIGIQREDVFNGGQLIELYHAFGETYDERLLQVLLLHNYDDIGGMLQLYAIMAIPMLFENGRFAITNMQLQDAVDASGQKRPEYLIRLKTDYSLPASLSCHGTKGILQHCFLSGRDDTVLVKLPVLDGELKYFYPDYKNYSYLPAEDQAIHKSVAVYVDKRERMPATAATCYTRKTGVFLPWFGEPADSPLPLFRAAYKEKERWISAEDFENQDTVFKHEYFKNCLFSLSGLKAKVKTDSNP